VRGQHLLTPVGRDIAVVFGERNHVTTRLGQGEQPQLVRTSVGEPKPGHVLRGGRIEPTHRCVHVTMTNKRIGGFGQGRVEAVRRLITP
jgi:hypothetical protein